MSMFNMGGVKDAKVVSNNFLRAGIHNVIFKGIDKADGFNAIELRFEAVDGSGIHNERIFEPRSEERTQSQYGTNPSESEQFMCKIKQVIDALDPELAHKIEADGDKFAAPDFDSFIALLKKYLDKRLLVLYGSEMLFLQVVLRERQGKKKNNKKFAGDVINDIKAIKDKVKDNKKNLDEGRSMEFQSC